MLLFCVSGVAAEGRKEAESPRTQPDPPWPGEFREKEGKAIEIFWLTNTDGWSQQDVISWAQISEASEKLWILNFEMVGPLEGHGGTMFQKKRTREAVREERDLARHVTESNNTKFLLGDKAHLFRDVEEAARFTSKNGPQFLRVFWKKQVADLRLKAAQCWEETEKWRRSQSDTQTAVQGGLNLPLLAHMMYLLKMGGQGWAPQSPNGLPIVGTPAEPGVYPLRATAGPEVSPKQLLTNSKWIIKPRRAAVTDLREGAPWEDALNQVEIGWLAGPFPYDEERRLVTEWGPQ